MKPVMQTDFGQFGNCFSACLASLFELPLEEVPNFFTVAGTYDDAAWWAAVRDWLRPRGYGIMFNDLRDPDHLKLFEGYFIVSGKSSRNVHHATIWKDGVMVHDPHQEQCGLVAPDGIDLIYPLDVSALAALSERGGEAVAYRYRMHPNFHWTLSYRFPVVPNNVEVQPLYTRPQAGQVSENAAQDEIGLDYGTPEGGQLSDFFAAPPAASEAQKLADRLEQYIPDGDGYDGEYAKTLTAAVAFLRGGSLE